MKFQEKVNLEINRISNEITSEEFEFDAQDKVFLEAAKQFLVQNAEKLVKAAVSNPKDAVSLTVIKNLGRLGLGFRVSSSKLNAKYSIFFNFYNEPRLIEICSSSVFDYTNSNSVLKFIRTRALMLAKSDGINMNDFPMHNIIYDYHAGMQGESFFNLYDIVGVRNMIDMPFSLPVFARELHNNFMNTTYLDKRVNPNSFNDDVSKFIMANLDNPDKVREILISGAEVKADFIKYLPISPVTTMLTEQLILAEAISETEYTDEEFINMFKDKFFAVGLRGFDQDRTSVFFNCLKYCHDELLSFISGFPNVDPNKPYTKVLVEICDYENGLNTVRAYLNNPRFRVNEFYGQGNDRVNLLIHAVQKDCEPLVEMLLARNDVDIELRDGFYKSALNYAKKGSVIEKMLQMHNQKSL